MTATWTTPKTWTEGETVDHIEGNTYIRDNQDFLLTRQSAVYDIDEASDLSLTATSFTNLDATEGNFQHTKTLKSTQVLVGWIFSCTRDASDRRLYIDVTVDGTAHGGDDGIMGVMIDKAAGGAPGVLVSGTILITGLTTGSRIFRLTYKVDGGTITLYRGAGTANADTHGQFWVVEL